MKIDEEEVEITDNFDYLGCTQGEKPGAETDIKYRINKDLSPCSVQFGSHHS